MHSRTRGLAILLLTLLLLGGAGEAAPDPATPDPATPLLRQAAAAWDAGDTDAAERLWAAAERLGHDPGGVAFNRGILAARREQWREAELCLRRCLSDPAIPEGRAARAWYNLGVVLLRGNPDDLASVRSAVGCLENARDRLAATDPLEPDCRYNLELARLIWSRLRARQATPQQQNPGDEPPERQPQPQPPAKTPDPPQVEPPSSPAATKEKPKVDPATKLDGKRPGDGKGQPQGEEKKPTPGAGRLPVLKDDGVVTPLNPEDTRALLQRVAERLERERLQLRREAARPGRDRDW